LNDDGREAHRNPLAAPWATVRAWHREAAFWREVYVRMVAALAAAGIVYFVAAVSGLVSSTPLAVVGILLVGVTSPFLIYYGADMVKHRKDVRFTVDWSLTPPRNEGEVRIRKVYGRAEAPTLIWVVGIALTVIGFLAR
jgi:multisubunit Na+/H+ antiporter MnhG subunit